ncbi:MAG: hypothetical protein WCF36_07975 [Candidatus Nanopelagicales bacterium]
MELDGDFSEDREAPEELGQDVDFTALLGAGVASATSTRGLLTFAADLEAQGVGLGQPPTTPFSGLSHQDLRNSPGTSVLQDFRPPGVPGLASAVGQWLRDTLSEGQVVRIDEPQYGYLDVPVVLLGAPDVVGAEVTWSETQSHARTDGLKVTVGVLGFGKSVTTQREEEIVETAAAGRTKQVLLQVPVMISAWGRRIGADEVRPFVTVERIEWDKYPQKWVTLDDLSLDAVDKGLRAGDVEDRRRASDAKKGSTRQAADRTSTFTIGLKAQIRGVQVAKEISLEVVGSARYDVAWTLPGRHSYRRYEPSRGLGLIWRTT